MIVKINFSILDESLEITPATILTIEDVTIFSSLVKDFYQYSEESKLQLFDEKNKSLKATELMTITDILGFDVNSTSLIKMVHADLEEQFNAKPEVKSTIEKLANTIKDLIVFECLENELDLEYDDITILELIKALGVKIETQSHTIFDKMIEILKIFNYLGKKKLLVFINSGAYLTRNELDKLIEYITLSHQKVLFLEPRELYDFPQYILDKDYFLISKNMV